MSALARAVELIGKPFVAAAWRLPPMKHTRRAMDEPRAGWDEHNTREFDRPGDGPLWIVLGDSSAQSVGASRYDAGDGEWTAAITAALRLP